MPRGEGGDAVPSQWRGARTRATQGWFLPMVAVLLAGCGADAVSTAPGWVSGHPNTARLSFDTTAPGICAITVRYPDEAPAVINYLGTIYVQVGRRAASSAMATDKLIDHSGNWEVDQAGGGGLVLRSPANTYDYHSETAC